MSKLRTALVVAASVAMAGSSFGSDLGPGQLAVSVDLGGGILNNIGGAKVTRSGTGEGEWIVTFKRDLKDCVWTGSIGYGKFQGFTVPAFISVNGQFNSTKGLYVQTWNGSSRALQDWPFTIIVLCS